MFTKHTPYASRRQHALPLPRHSSPGYNAMVRSAAARGLQPTSHALQCIVNGNDSAGFPVLSLVTLPFDL